MTFPDEPSPSLHPHYRGFITTTRRSASRRGDGTQPSRFLPLRRSLLPRRTSARTLSTPAFPRSLRAGYPLRSPSAIVRALRLAPRAPIVPRSSGRGRLPPAEPYGFASRPPMGQASVDPGWRTLFTGRSAGFPAPIGNRGSEVDTQLCAKAGCCRRRSDTWPRLKARLLLGPRVLPCGRAEGRRRRGRSAPDGAAARCGYRWLLLAHGVRLVAASPITSAPPASCSLAGGHAHVGCVSRRRRRCGGPRGSWLDRAHQEAGVASDLTICASLGVRRACQRPRQTSTNMMAARMKEAIAPQSMIWPISEKAYASSSRPRSVVPWNEVCSSALRVVLVGFASAAALIFA